MLPRRANNQRGSLGGNIFSSGCLVNSHEYEYEFYFKWWAIFHQRRNTGWPCTGHYAWSPVRFMLTLSEVYGWHARQIDCVLAFPPADVRTDIYVHVREKFRVTQCNLVLNERAPHPSKQNNMVNGIKIFVVWPTRVLPGTPT